MVNAAAWRFLAGTALLVAAAAGVRLIGRCCPRAVEHSGSPGALATVTTLAAAPRLSTAGGDR